MVERDWYQTQPVDELLDTEEEIFQYISDKVATYPQEIAGELGQSLRTVQHHLRRMFNDQRIGKIKPKFDRVPDRILFRLPELQSQNMRGVDIRNKTWYCVNETGAQLRERLIADGRMMPKYNSEVRSGMIKND